MKMGIIVEIYFLEIELCFYCGGSTDFFDKMISGMQDGAIRELHFSVLHSLNQGIMK
jgi:hypothetical protein